MPEACFRHGERELRLPSTLISISPEHFPAKWKPVRRPKMRPISKGWKGAELPCTTDGSGSRTRARWMFGVMSKTCFQHAQFRAGGSCVIVGRSALESCPARRIQFRGGSQQLRRGVLPKTGKQMAASANVTHGLPLRSPSRAECMETGTQRRSLTRFEAPPRSRHIAVIPPCAPSTHRVGGNLSAPQPFKQAKWRIAWPSAD